MGKLTIEQLAAKAVAALDGLDMTFAGLRQSTGLDGEDVLRTIAYLKSRGRIENLKGGLFHLRPDPASQPPTDSQVEDETAATINGYEEAWYQDAQEPPAEPAPDVTPDMVLHVLDILNAPATPGVIGICVKQEYEGVDLNTLGAALATLITEHRVQFDYDGELMPIYSLPPAQETSAVFEPLPEFDPEVERESVPSSPAEPETIVIDGWTCYLTYADLLPPLSPEEYAALKADIREHGMLVPLLLSQTGQDRHYHVLDGQHRLKIAVELGLRWMDIPKNYRNLLSEEQREELALNLNLHRRHLTAEQRQQYAVKMREQGDSLRAIGQRLGVDHKTVAADLEKAASTGEYSPVETVTGLDGKAHPAARPDPTQQQRDGDAIYTRFAGRDKVGHDEIAKSFPGIEATRRVKALEYLKASGKVLPVYGWPGSYKFSPPPKVEIPGEAALKATLDELRATFDQDKITILGRTDNGARDRAIEVARKLVAAGIWSGQTQIEFDAYRLHDKLFGAPGLDPRTLSAGMDYSFALPGIPSCPRIVTGIDPLLKVADPAHPDVPAEDQVAWTARELPTAQSEVLLATYKGEPSGLSKYPASTCTALSKRGLIEQAPPGGSYNVLELTEKGRGVAEYLIDLEASQPSVEALTAAQESTESPAKSALPPGMTFEQFHAPAHSDDHDPDLAAAIILRTHLDKATLDLLDAIQAFTRIRSIGGFVNLPDTSLEETSRQLNVLQGQLRDTLTHADAINRNIVNLLNARDEVPA